MTKNEYIIVVEGTYLKYFEVDARSKEEAELLYFAGKAELAKSSHSGDKILTILEGKTDETIG